MSKQNKDFLKDSFYKHSDTRAKRTDEMEQTCLVELIRHLVTARQKQNEKLTLEAEEIEDALQFMGIKRESDEYNDGDSSQ